MGIHHGAGSAASTDVLREIGATYREIGVRDRRGSWTSTLEKGATSSGAGSAAPPIYPLCCQRCTHLTAELALTANRSPAARREAPSATASITRSRKSSEHGLGIAHPPSAMPQESLIQPGLRIPYDSTTPKPALAEQPVALFVDKLPRLGDRKRDRRFASRMHFGADEAVFFNFRRRSPSRRPRTSGTAPSGGKAPVGCGSRYIQSPLRQRQQLPRRQVGATAL